MATKITRNVIESYLNCEYKGHLKLAGKHGTRSDYELLLAGSQDEIRRRASDKILARYPAEEIERDVVLTPAALKRGAGFLLNATLEDEHVSLAFDGLKRVPGPSKVGDFHYVPVLFFEGRQVRKQQRALLDVYALLLSRLQGRVPGSGIIWHGQECRAARVRLNADPRKAERLLEELRLMQGTQTPRLILNDHCTVCEFHRLCQQQATQEDNLSLLRGMAEKEVKAYARKGILTVTQLAHTFRPRRKGKKASPRADLHSHSLQALAIRDKKIYVFGTPEIPTSPVRVSLDVEGLPEEGFNYLIGLIVTEGEVEECYSFWANTREQEDQIFDQLLAILARYDDYLVFAYGGYERAFLKRMRKRAKKKGPVDRVLKSLINVLSLVYAHFYFPTYSNGLKEVGAYLGCSWSDSSASGPQSIVWRKRWEATFDGQWKQALLTYNMDDCAALKKVTEFIYAIMARGRQVTEPFASHPVSPVVEHVQHADELPGAGAWARKIFSDPDYAYINRCAYFDYQRERVYARTNTMLRRNRKKLKQATNRKLRVSKYIEIAASKCPLCAGTDLELRPRKKRAKRAFDLVITPGMIKRKVIECRAPLHICRQCGHRFTAGHYQRLDKHYHGLKCWTIYHHVSHGIGFGTLEELVSDLFGLRVYKPEFKMLRSLMARYYRTTYRQLLRKILSGLVLHMDETEVKLRSGRGYVWVFTNLEEVVFMYRPTREGDFLKSLLKDFHGVLVSDFYAVYDSIDCPQQKCLIHLIRDMNQELLGNPFDEELRALTRPFSALLRSILATVDQHGLKRSCLQRHAGDVASFFHCVDQLVVRSEAAVALQRRLLKYRAKLFTFIEHDGVPWNNNNAENAIKQFASYREKADGRLTEAGLNEFLVLLSICHTCRYKEIGFLKFLLSRERDFDTFGIPGRARRRNPVIEMYPKGFVPPHLTRVPKKECENPEMSGEQIDEERG
jgi:predicted RecB family nuclease